MSELCLGTLHFGWKTDERTSHAILDHFLRAGGNFLQATSGTPVGSAADVLAGAQPEAHIGSWMRQRRVSRASVVLATRFVVQDRPISDRALAGLVRRACERSLRRLRTDHLDLLLCEWSRNLLPHERLLAALGPLVRDGLVRYVGASSFPAWRVSDAMAEARRRSLPRFEAVQDDFSLVCRRRFDTELEDLCRDKRLAFLARSPLAGGFLVDDAPDGHRWASAGRELRLRDRFGNSRSLSARDVLEAIALARGTNVAQMALAWVLAHPAVTSALVGVTSAAQLANLMDATSLALSERELAMLDNPAVLTAPPARTGRAAHHPAETIELRWSPPVARRMPVVVPERN